MPKEAPDVKSVGILLITDGRSRVLAEPIRDHLMSFAQSRGLSAIVHVFEVPAAGEESESNSHTTLAEGFRAGAIGVLFSSSGSGLGMILNKFDGISIATCATEPMAIEVGRMAEVNGCEIFAGEDLGILFRIMDQFIFEKVGHQ